MLRRGLRLVVDLVPRGEDVHLRPALAEGQEGGLELGGGRQRRGLAARCAEGDERLDARLARRGQPLVGELDLLRVLQRVPRHDQARFVDVQRAKQRRGEHRRALVADADRLLRRSGRLGRRARLGGALRGRLARTAAAAPGQQDERQDDRRDAWAH